MLNQAHCAQSLPRKPFTTGLGNIHSEDESEPFHIMPVPLLDAEPKPAKTSGNDYAEPRAGKHRPPARFVRRAMLKSELAAWYGVSRTHFVTNYLPPVMSQLRKKGYHVHTRLLSLAMVNIICDFQDDPA